MSSVAAPRAMILAAGRGERMRPLTDHCPKPLLPACGKPLIVYHIEALARAGVREIVINHAHLGARIEAALGDGAAWGVRLLWSREEEALETAGGIRFALAQLGTAPFIVVNGDVHSDFDYARLVARAQALAADATDIPRAHLVLVANPPHNPQGDFALASDGRLLPADAANAPRLTFAGLGAYQPALFAGIPHGARAPLGPLLREAIARNEVSGEAHGGYWLDVGTPQRLAELETWLSGQPESR